MDDTANNHSSEQRCRIEENRDDSGLPLTTMVSTELPPSASSTAAYVAPSGSIPRYSDVQCPPRTVLRDPAATSTFSGTPYPGSTPAFHTTHRPPRPEQPPSADAPFDHYRYPSHATNVYNLLRKGDLSFSGKRSEDVASFLRQVEASRRIFPVHDSDLMACLPFFLKGVALQWYYNEQEHLVTWTEFRAAARHRFGDPNYQFALRQDFLRRTQGEQEPVADYLTNIRGIFNRLQPPWPESELIEYAYRNLLPTLQLRMHRDQFFDFESLQYVAVRAELTMTHARLYRAPPPPEETACPALAYHGPRSTRVTHPPVNRTHPAYTALNVDEIDAEMEAMIGPEQGRTVQSRPQRSLENQPRTPANPRRCWNCGRSGHRFLACTEARRVFCFGCGKADVIKSRCPKCLGNG